MGATTRAPSFMHRYVSGTDGSSLAARMRAQRSVALIQAFPSLESYRVLDLGGTRSWWSASPMLPAHVTLVNLDVSPSQDARFTEIRGDACALTRAAVGEFDLVFSNSVIEHVGGYQRRLAFAEVAQSLAPRWWVQTPYRYFPIEPHWVFPGLQFLPLRARATVAEKWHVGHMRSRSREEAITDCLETELLSRTELGSLFPGSRIWHERFLGLTKSLVAIGGLTS
jgi:hypothetical protein